MLGICAGGGYAIQAALTERRFRALGTVVASDLGRAFRRMVNVEETLEAVASQRTAEARGEPLRRDPWIPDSLREAKDTGVTDPEVLEAIAFYRESEFRHPNSTNRLLYLSPATDKHLFVVEGAGHYDLYYKSDPVAIAIGRLADFFSRTVTRR